MPAAAPHCASPLHADVDWFDEEQPGPEDQEQVISSTGVHFDALGRLGSVTRRGRNIGKIGVLR